MPSLKEIEEEYDLEILKLLELEKKEYKKLNKIRLRTEKIEILEIICAKDMLSKVKEVKEIETKLGELEMKILRKRYRNETIGLETLTKEETELKAKKQKTEDKIRKHRRGINTIISDAKDLRITTINKLHEMERIRTKIFKLEKDKDLDCIK